MVYVEQRREDLPVSFETGTVGDAMSRGVISCPPETPLRVVARMMATHGVHAIFVFEYTEEDDCPHLWAVVSDLDLVAATRLDLDTLTAGATAVTPLVSVSISRPPGRRMNGPVLPQPTLLKSVRAIHDGSTGAIVSGTANPPLRAR